MFIPITAIWNGNFKEVIEIDSFRHKFRGATAGEDSSGNFSRILIRPTRLVVSLVVVEL